jgi:hypothetical protein
MKFTNSALQNLRLRCLTAISYKREIALADEYQASLEAEAGSIAPQATPAHTILSLVERVILIRSDRAPAAVPAKAQVRPVVAPVVPVVALIEPVIAPEAIDVTDDTPVVESIVPPAMDEGAGTDDPPPDIKPVNQSKRSNRRK